MLSKRTEVGDELENEVAALPPRAPRTLFAAWLMAIVPNSVEFVKCDLKFPTGTMLAQQNHKIVPSAVHSQIK